MNFIVLYLDLIFDKNRLEIDESNFLKQTKNSKKFRKVAETQIWSVVYLKASSYLQDE